MKKNIIKNKQNKEENKIIKMIENKKLKSISNVKTQIKSYSKIFKESIKKRKMISLRILESDLKKAKQKADIEGISYQTLINSVIHKYLNGSLIARK